MRELTETDRRWLAAQVDRRSDIVIPAGSERRLRRLDLITTRHNRSFALTGLGYALALRLRYQIRLSCGRNAAPA